MANIGEREVQNAIAINNGAKNYMAAQIGDALRVIKNAPSGLLIEAQKIAVLESLKIHLKAKEEQEGIKIIVN